MVVSLQTLIFANVDTYRQQPLGTGPWLGGESALKQHLVSGVILQRAKVSL